MSADIAELRALLPWRGPLHTQVTDDRHWTLVTNGDPIDGAIARCADDDEADLIARALNALPELLDAAEERGRLREQIAAIRADLAAEVRSGAPTVPVVAAAGEHIARRLCWASMHWGTERVNSDAWPHVAHAAAFGVLEHLTALLDTSTPATEGGEVR